MKTRYPIKLGAVTFPAGTEVRPATLEEMQALWPGILMREGSPQVGVWFPGLPVPTVLHTSQLDRVPDPIPTWNAPKAVALECSAAKEKSQAATPGSQTQPQTQPIMKPQTQVGLPTV